MGLVAGHAGEEVVGGVEAEAAGGSEGVGEEVVGFEGLAEEFLVGWAQDKNF